MMNTKCQSEVMYIREQTIYIFLLIILKYEQLLIKIILLKSYYQIDFNV